MATNNTPVPKSPQSKPNPTAADRSGKDHVETQALFEQFFEASPDGVLVVDSQGFITRVNAQTEKMFGYSRTDLQGKPIEALVPDRFRKAHEAYRGNYQGSPQMRPMGEGMELFAKHRDGSEFPVEIMLSPIRSGDETMILTVVRDITLRKHAEDALRTSEEQLQSILDNSTTVIYVKDLESRYLRVNRRFEEIYDIPRGQDRRR